MPRHSQLRKLFAAVADEDAWELHAKLDGKAIGLPAAIKKLEWHTKERRRFSESGTPFVIVPLRAPEGTKRGLCLYLQVWLLQRSPTWQPRVGLPLQEYREDTITAVRVHIRELLRVYERNPVLGPHWDFAAYLRRGLACLEVERGESREHKQQRKRNARMYGSW